MGKPVKLDTLLQVSRTFGVRDGLLRLQYELQRGSGLLSLSMRSVQGWDFWNLEQIAPGTSVEGMLSARRSGLRRFFFSDAPSLKSSIEKIIGPDDERSVLAEANRILEGNLPYFGQLSYASGFPPKWFRNPVTGQNVSPDQPWTQMRFASRVYGDLKFILEPSRFLFVYPLIRAYALTADERFPQAFWNAVEDWTRHSPPMSGPLWICGQESSLRILALSFGLHSFINSPSNTKNRVSLLVSMIAAHAWRTAQTLGYARSQRSNHLITEAVGLWTAGVLYPELADAQLWRNLGAQILREAMLDNITPEGVSQQHSFNYQRMILHLLLWTLRLAEIHQFPLHEDIRARAESAYDFIRLWVDPISGQVPNYGSDDGSLIFPLSSSRYRDFRPLLQLGAAILNRPLLSPGPWDEAASWFGTQPSGVGKKDELPSSVEAGYFHLGDKNSWALIRAGRYTRRPFQADQLHVDLWWRGINLALDPGTYLYNGPEPWNNGFAGSAVHNTVTVDHQDQMRRAGRFLWIDWAQASGKLSSLIDQSTTDCFTGEHNGYKRFGITHRRAVQWLAGAGWIIVDDIVNNSAGAGEHDVRLHWLAPDLPFEMTSSPFRVTFTSDQSQIRWNLFSTFPAISTVVRAGKQLGEEAQPEFAPADTQLLGWHAPTYGDLQPAISLLMQTHSQLPVRFVTVVLTDESCKVQAQGRDVVVLRGNEREYRVSFAMVGTSSPLNQSLFPICESKVRSRFFGKPAAL
jgi:hypothetical protein